MTGPDRDDSLPAAVGPGDVRIWWLPGAGAPSRDRAGRVTAIGPTADGRAHLVTATSPDAGAWQLGVRLPDRCALPFVVGDAIAARVDSRVDGIHVVTDARITTESGALLVAAIESGDMRLAPEFAVGVGGVIRTTPGTSEIMAAQLTLSLRVERAGKVAVVSQRRWRRLDTPEGVFLVSGFALGWEPGKPLPPDASAYHVVWIVRA